MIRPLPKIKFCGVTRESDLLLLAAAGVDSVGFNLVPASPRYIAPARARQLSSRAAELKLVRVGVVMDPSDAELQALIDGQLFDFIQLHGTECPAMLASLRLPVAKSASAEAMAYPALIKAVSWSGREAEVELVRDWQVYRHAWSEGAGPELRAFLVDAYAPGQGGGTGKKARWDLLKPRPNELSDTPLILAGGLTAENVDAAISATSPDGVDTASGVESAPGLKDAELVRAFASNASEAFLKQP